MDRIENYRYFPDLAVFAVLLQSRYRFLLHYSDKWGPELNFEKCDTFVCRWQTKAVIIRLYTAFYLKFLFTVFLDKSFQAILEQKGL